MSWEALARSLASHRHAVTDNDLECIPTPSQESTSIAETPREALGKCMSRVCRAPVPPPVLAERLCCSGPTELQGLAWGCATCGKTKCPRG